MLVEHLNRKEKNFYKFFFEMKKEKQEKYLKKIETKLLSAATL